VIRKELKKLATPSSAISKALRSRPFKHHLRRAILSLQWASVIGIHASGVMDARSLYESPFLDISPQGPEGLFSVAKVEKMVQILQEIELRAVA
jgi:hypothetical protein